MGDETRRQHIEDGTDSRDFPQVRVGNEPERDGQLGQRSVETDEQRIRIPEKAWQSRNPKTLASCALQSEQ
jgi:hypothetical protein